MKLLFNKSNASEELKELLGFLDADFSFDNIKADLITATRAVISVIGKEVYESAVELYSSEGALDDEEQVIELDDDQEFFLYCIRYPIAVQAYRLFAPTNDLSHTNNGRKMRMDDHEKNAFQWMIDSDNDALEKRYYRALDDLLQHLEESENAEWLASEEYKSMKGLFVSGTPDFDHIFPIESRLLFLKLVPGLKRCQQYEIRPRLSEKYSELLDKLKTDEEISSEEKTLLNVIKEAMVYFSLSWAMPRLSVNIFPEGVLQAYRSERNTTQSRKPTERMQTEQAQLAFKQDFDIVILELERLLTPAPVVDPLCKEIDPRIIKGNNFIST